MVFLSPASHCHRAPEFQQQALYFFFCPPLLAPSFLVISFSHAPTLSSLMTSFTLLAMLSALLSPLALDSSGFTLPHINNKKHPRNYTKASDYTVAVWHQRPYASMPVLNSPAASDILQSWRTAVVGSKAEAHSKCPRGDSASKFKAEASHIPRDHPHR